MKKLLLIISSILFVIKAGNSQTDSLYLGQTPPGTTPKRFYISHKSGNKTSERISISTDGKEIYYGETTNENTHYWLKYFTYSNGAWSDSTLLFDGYTGPALSPSGDTLFFHKYSNGYSGTAYYSVRNDTGWSIPTKFTSSTNMCYLHRTNSGNYYLIEQSESKGISKMVINGSDTTFHSLGLGNTDFFISRDESYLIFQLPNGEFGYHDLYISYRKNDDTWTNPKNLGSPINTNYYDVAPYVTPDNKYLFFKRASWDQLTYWVQIDALIETLKHTNFVPYLKSPIPDQTAFLDSSFIYQFPDSTFIDDDGNYTLTYSATLSNGNPLPDWLAFNGTTRTFSTDPLTVATTISLKVTATDTADANASCIFKITVRSSTGIAENNNRFPKESTLYQNFPNPFNPLTEISYSIQKADFVTLKIYNMSGQEIQTLVNKFQEAGSYSITFNANKLSSGIYFYKFQAGDDYIKTKKMILMH